MSAAGLAADNESARQWWNRLTAREQDAVQAYCDGADQRTNGVLLSGRTPTIAAALDSALERVESSSPRTLYRAMFGNIPTHGRTPDRQMLHDLPTGTILDFPGYLAATTRRHHIEVPDPDCTVILELRTRDGALLGQRMPGGALLPRGTRWRVIGHQDAASSAHHAPTVFVVPDASLW